MQTFGLGLNLHNFALLFSISDGMSRTLCSGDVLADLIRIKSRLLSKLASRFDTDKLERFLDTFLAVLGLNTPPLLI